MCFLIISCLLNLCKGLALFFNFSYNMHKNEKKILVEIGSVFTIQIRRSPYDKEAGNYR